MKKAIIILVALIVVALLVLIGINLLSKEEYYTYSSEEALCPYTVKEQKDGSFLLEIDDSAVADCIWEIEVSPMDVVVVAEDTDKEETAYTLHPVSRGDSLVSFVCLKREPYPDRSFAIELLVSVDSENTLSMAQISHRELTGITEGGKDSKMPYLWWTDEGGSLNLVFTDCDFNVEAKAISEGLTVDGPRYEEEDCLFVISASEEGSYTFVVYPENGEAVEVSVKTDKNAVAMLDAISPSEYVDESEESKKDYEIDGVKYIYTEAQTLEELTSLVSDFEAVSEEQTISGRTVTVYSFSGGMAAFWQTEDCFGGLLGSTTDKTAFTSALEKIMVEKDG